MTEIVRADEAGLEPFIERINECINTFACDDACGGVRISSAMLPRSDKQQKRLIKLLHEAG